MKHDLVELPLINSSSTVDFNHANSASIYNAWRGDPLGRVPEKGPNSAILAELEVLSGRQVESDFGKLLSTLKSRSPLQSLLYWPRVRSHIVRACLLPVER